MRFISAISISSALMWAAYANPLPQDKEAGGLSQPKIDNTTSPKRSAVGMDIITEIDLVAAREQLQELDAREPVEGDGDSQDLNVDG
ncbi:hypothetical protein DFH08DRAFT_959828 [Mycena albidolilacea]|uniref:Uncharacterized protein n=1 Tax=Mycena albidolilacea TaxID=1033008 RepID=A0AAD7A2Z5_9AGAR|nr:hypothetical protein DFH08DRAFT_959828 [Mycena albidolilacea]